MGTTTTTTHEGPARRRRAFRWRLRTVLVALLPLALLFVAVRPWVLLLDPVVRWEREVRGLRLPGAERAIDDGLAGRVAGVTPELAARRLLEILANDRDAPFVRAWVAFGFLRRGTWSAEVAAALAKGVESRDAEVQQASRMAVVYLMPEGIEAPRPLVESIRWAALEAPDPSIRADTVGMLLRVGSPSEAAREAGCLLHRFEDNWQAQVLSTIRAAGPAGRVAIPDLILFGYDPAAPPDFETHFGTDPYLDAAQALADLGETDAAVEAVWWHSLFCKRPGHKGTNRPMDTARPASDDGRAADAEPDASEPEPSR